MKIKYYAMTAMFIFSVGDLSAAEECPSADTFLSALVSYDDSEKIESGSKILGFEVLLTRGDLIIGLGDYAPKSLVLLKEGAYLEESVKSFSPGKAPHDFKTSCGYRAEDEGRYAYIYVGKN